MEASEPTNRTENCCMYKYKLNIYHFHYKVRISQIKVGGEGGEICTVFWVILPLHIYM